MKMTRLLSRLFCLSLVSVLFALPASAAVNVSFDVATSEDRSDPTRLAFTVDPGDSVEDFIYIVNADTKPYFLEIAAVDSVFMNNDTFLLEPTDEQHYFGSWVSFEETVFEVEANSKVKVPFTLNVPSNIGPGDYMGGFLLFESSPTGSAPSEGGSGIAVLGRIGLGIPVTVNGAIQMDFSISDSEKPLAQYDSSTGTYKISYTFNNEGNISVDPTMTIAFKNFGLFDLGTITPTLSRIYNGGSSQVTVDWENPPRFGFVQAFLTLEYERSNVFGKLTEEELAETRGVLNETTWIFIIPWFEFIASLALFILVFLGLYFKEHRLQKLRKTLKPLRTEKAGSLVLLATHYGVDWKLLAKVNHIKPPYVFEKGQTLLVPSKKRSKGE